MEDVFPAKIWFVKTSTRIVKHESQVVKLNPGFLNVYFQFFCGRCNRSNKLLISIFPKNSDGSLLFFFLKENIKLGNAGLKAVAV